VSPVVRPHTSLEAVNESLWGQDRPNVPKKQPHFGTESAQKISCSRCKKMCVRSLTAGEAANLQRFRPWSHGVISSNRGHIHPWEALVFCSARMARVIRFQLPSLVAFFLRRIVVWVATLLQGYVAVIASLQLIFKATWLRLRQPGRFKATRLYPGSSTKVVHRALLNRYLHREAKKISS